MKLAEDARENRKLKNIEYYKIAIRQLSKNVLFFPAHNPQLFEFDCRVGGESANPMVCGFEALASQVINNSLF